MRYVGNEVATHHSGELPHKVLKSAIRNPKSEIQLGVSLAFASLAF
jgi:hypothetical protein